MSTFEKAAAIIEKSIDGFIELQSLLTAIPALAPENGGEGECAKCAALEQWLKANGITNLTRYDAPDERVPTRVRPNLVAEVTGKDTSRAVWIMSHLDVVPAGERSLWHTEPFAVTQKDGKLYGRGTEDDQQGLVCSVFALLSLIRAGITPAFTVKLLFVADEEVGSTYGVHYLLEHHNLFNKNDIIITPDGGDPIGETIEIAEKNLLWLRVRTVGKQAHGSMPDDGINAHLANCELALMLHGLESVFDTRDPLFAPSRSTFSPTKKEANVPNINTIPGEDVFYMDCRVLPCYPLDTVRAEVRRTMDKIEAKYGVTVTFTEEQAAESPATPADAPVVSILSSAIRRVLKTEPRLVGIGGGTVAAALRSRGFHTAVWSKQDETMHQPDEYCVIANLLDEAKVLASVMMNNE